MVDCQLDHYWSFYIYIVFKLITTVNLPAGTLINFSVTLDGLNEHFIPKRILKYELLMFISGKQENDETMDQFHS